jgi:hypothetical protein
MVAKKLEKMAADNLKAAQHDVSLIGSKKKRHGQRVILVTMLPPLLNTSFKQ